MTNRATSEAKGPFDSLGPARLLQLGKERTDAMINVHKELFDAYREAGQAWVNRVKSEVEFWSDLTNKLAASRTVPEGLETYRDSMTQRMEMAAEDGRRLFEDGQKMIATVTGSVANGLSEKTKQK
jgi:hypothetical protein